MLLPDRHPITGEPTRLVVGYVGPMTAADLRAIPMSSARGESRPAVDMAYARALASRRVGPRAEAAVGRALLDLAAKGHDTAPLAQAMREVMHLAEGVASGAPTPIAVATARRMATPQGVATLNGRDGAADLLALAYAVLHLDEARRLDQESRS